MIATSIDYSFTLLFVEILQVWYTYGVAFGALMGAVTHFFTGRLWAFKAREERVLKQGLKYLLVSIGSFFMNVGGVYLLTENSRLHYIVSKVIVAVVVAFAFNFTMHRYFVFKA